MQVPLALRPDLIDAFVSLGGAALLQGEEEDACALIDAMRPWRGNSTEISFFDAWLAMVHEDYVHAARLLRVMHEGDCGEKSELIECLLSAVLLMMEDPAWEKHANEVIASNQFPAAVRVAQGLLGIAPAAGTGSPDQERPGQEAAKQRRAFAFFQRF
jgi:Bacterial type III secretion protein (HrpB1_HrpK)